MLRVVALIGALVGGVASSGCAISRRDEIRMGADYAAQLDRELSLIHDAELLRYLAVLHGRHVFPWGFSHVRATDA